MRYHALACDYDGTLAWEGSVSAHVIDALHRLKDSGRKLLLVTGRELGDLKAVFHNLELFDRVVAENGALLYRPATGEQKVLGEAPPEALVERLRALGVQPLSVGASIIATVHPWETTVVRAIRDLGFEHQVVFNKGSVMVLPPTVNKGTGLSAALDELMLSPHNTVAIGDAENDHAFLSLCECSIAVADALPVVKQRADLVTRAGSGEGVAELAERLLSDDLASIAHLLERHDVPLGTAADGRAVKVRAYGESVLIAGPSGSGKSTVTMGFLEGVAEGGYQFCVIDPEGDYGSVDRAVALGSNDGPPTPDEVLNLLQSPAHCAVVNLTGLALQDRPGYFARLFPRLQELRAHTGRPHWVVVDEAHHLLPMERESASQAFPPEFTGLVLVTVEPSHVARNALATVDWVVAVGDDPGKSLNGFANAVGMADPALPTSRLPEGDVWVWSARGGAPPVRIRPVEARAEHLRHRRKYAEGDVGDDRSFYFRGAAGKLNLRAQNLLVFLQIAEGIDDETWAFHLARGDYARWFRDVIKDPDLAAESDQVARQTALSPNESRERIAEAIRARYTNPT